MGQVIDFPLGLFEIVEKLPSVGGGEPPMVIFLGALAMSEYSRRQRQPKSLWISSGMNFMSPLDCFFLGYLPV